ncbi:PREDICTED: RING-H2 finger protein ATL20-like [Nelumbo nucifera]|uniref:RING-H2 finger protein ATL20-like n=1 Tax=Nelumbo nucifera TaxID=4432 RepID=A0A1U8AAA8_NELNU|nr:PREDICTED: RING-H2 finger protein ATL20-like [Nelumbo nucifera]
MSEITMPLLQQVRFLELSAMKSAEILKPPLQCNDIRVLIKLSVDEKRQWIGRSSEEEDEAIIVEVEEENRTVSIPFWLSLLFLPWATEAVIGQSLSSMNYFFRDTSKFIKRVLSDYAREIAEHSFSLVTKPKTIVIVARIEVQTTHHGYDEDEQVAEAVSWESTEASSEHISVVPASLASIDALPTHRFGNGESNICCGVCLEVFSLNEQVKEMPCSHVFHRECIVRWLLQRNVCPLCRHEMPTD